MQQNDNYTAKRESSLSNRLSSSYKVEKSQSISPNKREQKLSSIYKDKCKKQFNREPPSYISNNFIKQQSRSICIDLELIKTDDLQFITELFNIPIKKIQLIYQQKQQHSDNPVIVKRFHQTSKFKEFLTEMGTALQNNLQIKTLNFVNVTLSISHIKTISKFLKNLLHLKQLSLQNCNFTVAHLQQLKLALAQNQSLNILNLSNNLLDSNSGGMLGKILSEHSVRRNDIVWMATLRSDQTYLEQDPSTRGICEINLQNNKLQDQGIRDLINYLKEDKWTRCINLKNNNIQKIGIKKFATLMKSNQTIISLDLRDNPGFTQKHSKHIIERLKLNLQNYRKYKTKLQPDHQPQLPRHYMKHSRKTKKIKLQEEEFNSCRIYTPQKNKSKQSHNIATHKEQRQSTIKTYLNKQHHSQFRCKQCSNIHNCRQCKKKTLLILKLQKKYLELQLKIRKLEKLYQVKNSNENSDWFQPHSQTISYNFAFKEMHKITDTNPQSDNELFIKIELIMIELTKIIENIDVRYKYEIKIPSHNLDNTIPTFHKGNQLEDIEEIGNLQTPQRR